MVNEKRKNDFLFEVTGGIRIGDSYWGSSNVTWPLAKIKIFKRKIILNSILSKIELKKTEIKYIERYKGLFSSGIRIHHKKPKSPSFIIFWSLSTDKLLKKIKNSGYKIK